MNPPLALIAAVSRNGVIGRDGQMPWRLPGDLAHFRDATWAKPMIMGRRTFEAIGRPLPGRSTVVVSRDLRFQPAGVTLAGSIDEALATARTRAAANGADAVMGVGGGAVYAALLPLADVLLITRVELEPTGDTVFPPISSATWALVSEEAGRRQAGDEADYAFLRYERRPGGSPPESRR